MHGASRLPAEICAGSEGAGSYDTRATHSLHDSIQREPIPTQPGLFVAGRNAYDASLGKRGQDMGEVELAALLCAFLAGSETETRHYFDDYDQKRYVRIDCETDTHVIEVGLDQKASSRDSVHQALFAAFLTGKKPMVVLIDRDGFEGRFEYEMRQVTRAAGVAYARCSEDFIQRWAATAPFRAAGSDKRLDDLPREASARSQCDLTEGAGAQTRPRPNPKMLR